MSFNSPALGKPQFLLEINKTFNKEDWLMALFFWCRARSRVSCALYYP